MKRPTLSRSLARGPLCSALALAVSASLLGGCMLMGPDYQRPALEIPPDYPEPAGTDPAALRADWWTLYSDPVLNELIASAQKNSADIRLAAAQLEEADAVLREVDANQYPQIDGSFANTRSRVSSVTAVPVPSTVPLTRNNRRLAASTSFELDFWGRLRRGTEAARAAALSSRYGRDVVALSLAGTTSQAYFSLRSTDAQIAVTRVTLKAREDSLEVVRNRAASGISSDLEVNQAIGARSDAALQLRDLERQRKLFEHQLGVLTGNLAPRAAPGCR